MPSALPHHSGDHPLSPAQICNRPSDSAQSPTNWLRLSRQQMQLHPSGPEARLTPALPLLSHEGHQQAIWAPITWYHHLRCPSPSCQATSLPCCAPVAAASLVSPAPPCPPSTRGIFTECKAGHRTPLLKTLRQLPRHSREGRRPPPWPVRPGPPVLFPLCPLSGLAGLLSKVKHFGFY